jgi:hypothetical protein
MNSNYRPTRLHQTIAEMEGYISSSPYLLDMVEDGKCIVKRRENPEREYFIIDFQEFLRNLTFEPYAYDSVERIQIELPDNAHFAEKTQGIRMHRQLTDFKYTSAIHDLQTSGYQFIHTNSHYHDGNIHLEEYMIMITPELFMIIRKYFDNKSYYIRFINPQNIPIPLSTFEFSFL